MTSTLTHLMQRATALTRSGDLQAATALIQSEVLNKCSAPEQGPQMGWIQAQRAAVARATASICNAEPAHLRAMSGCVGFAQSLSAFRAPDDTRAPQHATHEGNIAEVIDVVARAVHEHPQGPGVARPGPPRGRKKTWDGPAFSCEGQPPSPQRDDPLADAGEFIRGSHAAAGLQCDYRLFIPAGAAPGAPLIVMLHGCTQTPEDFATGTRMNEVAGARGCFVLYPAQSQRMNPQRCWNWFKHTHQSRGRGEPALLESLTREITARHDLDRSRIYVAGLSAGGAMAALLAQACPETFAAVGVHSGLPAGAARDLPSALNAMKSGPARALAPCAVPCIVFHGDADTTVHRHNGDALAQSIPRDSVQETCTVPATPGGRAATHTLFTDAQGRTSGEHWVVHGAPHAWSGGSPGGSYTDPHGPDASAEMVRFFLDRH